MLAVIALRQGDRAAAKEAFATAYDQASRLNALTAQLYKSLDSKGLALCGQALCGDAKQVVAAKAAFQAARAITSELGITREVLRLFDALALADPEGLLATARPAAAGVSSGPFELQIRIRGGGRAHHRHTHRLQPSSSRTHPRRRRAPDLRHAHHGERRRAR